MNGTLATMTEEGIKTYVDSRLEDAIERVRAYVDLKVAEINGEIKELKGQGKGLEGQVQGLSYKIDGLENRFEGLRSEVRAHYMNLSHQYSLLNAQYNEMMKLMQILLERTSPERIGFDKTGEQK